MLKVGIDVGSTTMKTVAMREDNTLVYSDYQRHFSQIIEKGREMLQSMMDAIGDEEVTIALSGSAGMGLAEAAGIPFVQEVYATRVAAKTFIPDTDTIIELGGEDAKILFLKNGLEVRMNGTCAGGTGAFIDQMATLLGISRDDIDRLDLSTSDIVDVPEMPQPWHPPRGHPDRIRLDLACPYRPYPRHEGCELEASGSGEEAAHRELLSFHPCPRLIV